MEQQIAFCTTEDGVRLAYAVMGEGPPIFLVPTWANSIELDEDYAEGRAFKESLARDHQLITWDARGIGMSQREVGEISLESGLADLHAVVEHLGHQQFQLIACVGGTPIALAYAARHGESISRLVLCGAYAAPSEMGKQTKAAKAFVDLIRDNWDLAARAIGGLMFPSGPVDAQVWLSGLVRSSASAQVAAQYTLADIEVDVAELVGQVTTPTLLIHYRRAQRFPIEAGRAVAALLPNARLVAFDADAEHYYQGHQQWIDTVLKFLDEGREEKSETRATEASALRIILFTDMESSTAMTQRLGDAKAQEVRRTHNEIVRAALGENGGNEIKYTGDGIMASFLAASAALECAVAIQRGVAAHVEEHPDSPLGVYIGINAGEPIAEEGDLFGTSVNLAARICDHAQPAQILASDVVRQLAAGKDFLFSDLGETELRGFEDPIKLWELRWREQA